MGRNSALIGPETTGTTEFLAIEIEAKLQATRRPRRTQRSLGEESGVKFELKELASIPADDRNEFAFTLETLAFKKFANVHIFEAIKKELDARMMKNSGKVSSENRTLPLFRKISFSSVRSSSFLRPVFIPDGFNVSDVKFVLTTLTSLA